MANAPERQKIVKSSLIRAYSYDSQSLTLSVTFTDGSEFDYEKVDPPTMSKVFDSPGSVGGKFRKLIANNFKHQKTS
jgi:hypothetical protein